MPRRLAVLLASAAVVAALAACAAGAGTASRPAAESPPPPPPVRAATTSVDATAPNDLISVLVRDEKLSKLALVMHGTGLTDLLARSGPFTVFAPSDGAFAKLEPAFTDLVASGRVSWLTARMRYHVVAGSLPPAALRGKRELRSVTGERIRVTTEGGRILLNGQAAVEASHAASPGWVYRIDRVLRP